LVHRSELFRVVARGIRRRRALALQARRFGRDQEGNSGVRSQGMWHARVTATMLKLSVVDCPAQRPRNALVRLCVNARRPHDPRERRQYPQRQPFNFFLVNPISESLASRTLWRFRLFPRPYASVSIRNAVSKAKHHGVNGEFLCGRVCFDRIDEVLIGANCFRIVQMLAATEFA
jgi:hypothetical protein